MFRSKLKAIPTTQILVLVLAAAILGQGKAQALFVICPLKDQNLCSNKLEEERVNTVTLNFLNAKDHLPVICIVCQCFGELRAVVKS